MKTQKTHEMRLMTDDQIRSSIKQNEETITTLRFQQAIGQLHNTAQLPSLRKEIARMKTLLHERSVAPKA